MSERPTAPGPFPAAPPPLPLLVAGLAGVPGHNAFRALRARFGDGVVGVRAPGQPGLAGAGVEAVDLEDRAALSPWFRRRRFRAVLDASGCCALKSCEHNPALARKVNVEIGLNLARLAAEGGCRLVRLSSDLVFGGAPRSRGGMRISGGYTEDEAPSPVTVYGRSMAEAEEAISGAAPEGAILRIALPMGPSPSGHAGAIDWIGGRFRRGRPATLFFDEVRSNLYVQDLAAALAHFLARDWAGVFHLGGPRPLSLYRIGQVINRVGGFAPALLMGCPRAAAGPVPPRAGDVSLDSDRAAALLPPGTLGPWPRDPGLVPDGPDWHARRPHPPEADGIARRLYAYAPPG